jgi:redox-sensitive bicupin YhaK (pirin superfamily)
VPGFQGGTDEDIIKEGKGFPPHPHKNMEILTYVLEGALEHKDSMGHTSVIKPGEVQYMSAGRGVVHSKFNHLTHKPTHLYQIWILPSEIDGAPSYAQKSFTKEIKEKNLVLAVSKDGREGSIQIKQDADLYLGNLKKGETLSYPLSPQRGLWLQMVKGHLRLGHLDIKTGDGLGILEEEVVFLAQEDCQFLLFDLL